MIFGMTTFTFVHVVLSLIGIVSGVVVVAGFLASRRFGHWTTVYLASMLATCITGFGFPFAQLLPSHIVGVITLVLLAGVILARYVFNLFGAWRWVYVLGIVISLYLNFFVLVVQLFLKIPAFNKLAPTQSEPPFLIAQLAVLVVFIALGIASTIKFRNRPLRTA